MRTLLLSRYGRLGASSRVRLFQYLPYLESEGWQFEVSALFSDRYLQALYAGKSRGIQAIIGYWLRLLAVVGVKKYDLIWIEKEVFPFMPAVAEWLLSKCGVPYVVDCDDALFHQYDRHRNWAIRLLLGGKIDTVMRHAALVVAGNEYLAERARAAGAKAVEIVPTVVDLARYKVAPAIKNEPLVVGWIGSPATCGYLSAIAPAIEIVSQEFEVRFVAVGASEEGLRGLPFEAWHWSEETEVKSVQAFDIGIMPLVDSPWERGKCGYKLIQFMACGLPVVASPVGVNVQIVKPGENGFLAQTALEWERSLRELLGDENTRRRMGANGRESVESWYSMQVQAPRLRTMICGVVRQEACSA